MRSNKTHFAALVTFLFAAALVLTNGFTERIWAQRTSVDTFESIEPIGIALHEVMTQYVDEPDVDRLVEGALNGMMRSLDRHSAFVPPEAYQQMHEDTQGKFFGIGVSIELDENDNVVVRQPIPNTPASRAPLYAGDVFVEVDDQPVSDIEAVGAAKLGEVARMIKGPRGTVVKVKIVRPPEENDPQGEVQVLTFDIKRDEIPLESVLEARVLDDGIGYIRIRDFKDTTAEDLVVRLKEMEQEGMRALVLDLRWNLGGLLTASKQVSELFLPRRTLVTYTKGRAGASGSSPDDMELYTQRSPVVSEDLPIILLTSKETASSAEIVTGALQFHKRAIVVGEKTFGKGSVQTIIPLERPQGSALRLTTALYYTPAGVTIHESGIRPDVEVEMPREEQRDLLIQMWRSHEDDPLMKNEQNHGTVTGNTKGELDEEGNRAELVEDKVLAKAVEILNEDLVWANLVEKYHKPASETQVAAAGEDGDAAAEEAAEVAAQ